ncbi:hypothetical protein ACFP81_10210 [Deinococcus lacus]|uniref:Anti-bacteriophage protein A/HamA C-terminal domain-containing protein n=1 Tax=Deinococcus lacus TaxID=392561 RepID=A0ABW1YFW3_9DEIO
MAKSPAHRFGQIIGYYFESAIEKFLRDAFPDGGPYYIDRDGNRPARGTKKSVKWLDDKGNEHKLDYVVEKGGTPHNIGELAGIIEIAWRSYTKHSKNKVQEIEGAVTPISRKYALNRPFKGAILAGEFTSPSLDQLRSHNFTVIYFDKAELAPVFLKFGIDILIKEGADDSIAQAQIDAYDKLSDVQRAQLASDLNSQMRNKMLSFVEDLKAHLLPSIQKIYIAHNYSQAFTFLNASDAIDHLKSAGISRSDLEFSDYLIIIEFTTCTRIEIRAKTQSEAIGHLERYL